MTLPDPPDLLHYRTWTDEEGFHAEHRETLPESALAYGCQQRLSAYSELELTQEAVRNRIKISAWETRP